nr:type II toxin-antitoxin system prevent-host-death family antitoxin [Jatrophihabitans endophyticus]
MSASEASRAFSAVLDQAERGETIVITRGGRRVATISGAPNGNWAAFCAALDDQEPAVDSDFERDVVSVHDDPMLGEDPWRSG